MLVVAIDPGMSTGVVFARLEAGEPIRIIDKMQVEGGLPGLASSVAFADNAWKADVLVREVFRTRPVARSYRMSELEPIRIEGWLDSFVADFPIEVVDQAPGARALSESGVSGNRAILLNMGLWTTGKQVGASDADDVNSAMAHLVHYAASINHGHTLAALGQKEEG